ncbi:hypothetical protein [Clostridium sp. ZBS12]|uniref:hypothetical protein n=1 Tax=Clostridium sp. ZBS12 TaxID=2949972 RepID=UPI002079BC84|nr:hypothetical protein [Clostridium sp. ZBS12]
MYAMPIVGESVMLYFPNRYDEPIVTGCVRKNGSSCSKLSNTNNRHLSTESGNNLDILPGAINFYRSGMNVNLNDENGVNISSSGNLSLGASGGISLSGGSVSISGSNKVLVKKNKSSYISLEGECYNQSNAVYENGSCRETYEPFTDDDPQNGVAEALAEQMKMNEAALLAAADGSNSVVGQSINILNNPLNIRQNRPWMNINSNIKFPENESYIIPSNKKTRPITKYEILELDRRSIPGEYKLDYIFKAFSEYVNDIKGVFVTTALVNGMDPQYAELYGEFSVGMVGEFGLTISASGVKAANVIISGENVFSKSEIIAGSGIGNVNKGASKATNGHSSSREIFLDTASSHDSARKVLINELDSTGAFNNGSKAYQGRLQSSYGYGKQIGRQSLDGKVRWRLDFDSEIGVHYNIEDFTNGKGVNAIKKVIPVDIPESEYREIIDLWD